MQDTSQQPASEEATPIRDAAKLTPDQILISQEMSLSRLISTGAIADRRGALIISSNIGMMGALVAALSSKAFPVFDLALWGLVGLTGVLSLVSIGAAVIAGFPQATLRSQSLIFFASISRMTATAYHEKIHSISHADYARDLSEQCHQVAKITAFKFRYIRYAMAMFIISAAPWLLALSLAQRLPILQLLNAS